MNLYVVPLKLVNHVIHESNHRVIYGWNDMRHNLMRSDSLARASHSDFAQGIGPFLPPSLTRLALKLLKTSKIYSGQVIYIGILTSIGQT